MKPLVEKMKKLGLLRLYIVVGALLMAASFVGLPISIMLIDATLLQYPILWGVMLIGMLFFASVAFICFIRPYILYRKTPDVLAETDGRYLYIHGKKEAKIPLADLAEASVHVWLPYIYQEEFVAEFIVHLFSEKYGDLVLNVPGYGTYRMRFVARVRENASSLADFIYDALRKA